MILAVDAGNTRVKWGVHNGRDWLALGAVPHTQIAELAGAWRSWAPLQKAIVSNVAGPDCAQQLDVLLAPLASNIEWFRSQAQLGGVINGYERPEQLGSDRFAALIGARGRYSQACVVATAGTALTVDALSASGAFLGGMIVPGLQLMLGALTQGTADLQAFPGHFQDFPRNTADAMATGGIQAACGAVMRMVDALARHEGQAPQVVLSGGASRELSPHLALPHEIIDTLVLDGLIGITTR